MPDLTKPDDAEGDRLISRHLVRFVVVGLSNLVISYSTFWLSLRLLGGFMLRATVSQMLAYAISTAWSYHWNRRWTFRSDAPAVKEATRFVILQVAFAIISTALIGTAVDWLRLPDTLVWVGVMGFITMCNYTLSKLWVFAMPKDQRK
jgi:putative flippase GtrA